MSISALSLANGRTDGGEGVDNLVAGLASPLAMASFARSFFLPRGELERAHALCDSALRLAPEDAELQAVCAEVFSRGFPNFYFPMVADDARYAAYERALGRALEGGGRVLDLGSGTGLFAMLAARAGASEVVSCESRPVVAEAARAVIEANGLSATIKVVAKASAELEIGADLSGRADVLVWDNLTSDLVGAGALPAIEDATRRLLTPGARVIPERCDVVAALAQDLGLGARRMGAARGFDLSPFNRYAVPSYTMECDDAQLELRSTSTVVFGFDFSAGGPFSPGRSLSEVRGSGGRANGVVQWLELRLDAHERCHTAPGPRVGGLGPVFHPFATPIETPAGGRFAIGASHDRERIRLWRQSAHG